MTRDPATYCDPEVFWPERYMEQGSLQNPADLVFGFGRRACPGRLFADANIWLAIVQITATFAISKALDTDGNEFELTAAFTDGFVRYGYYKIKIDDFQFFFFQSPEIIPMRHSSAVTGGHRVAPPNLRGCIR